MHLRYPAKVSSGYLWCSIHASVRVLLRQMQPRVLLSSWLDFVVNATRVFCKCVGRSRICDVQAAGA